MTEINTVFSKINNFHERVQALSQVEAPMQKVEIWGTVKVDHKIYRDNEILQLIGRPIAHWEFVGDLPDDECDICVGFGEEKQDFPGSDRYALQNALDHARQCLGEGS